MLPRRPHPLASTILNVAQPQVIQENPPYPHASFYGHLKAMNPNLHINTATRNSLNLRFGAAAVCRTK